MQLPLFRSLQSGFCTCLPKYNLNTYVGRCAHQCIYCYAVKFPSFRGPTKPRLKLLKDIEIMAKNTKTKLPVMISDCTDPYQPLERDYKITRKCIETLTKYNFPILIVTKSDLVVRDIPFFKQASTVVSMSITTLNRDVTSFIEPCAPPPERRVSALQRLVEKGFTTIVRIDPLIPTLNDDEKDLERLVKVLADIGIKQVTTATMKPVKGFFQYLRSLDLELHDQLFRIYSQGEYIMGYKYLKKDLRWKIMQKIHSIVRKYGIEFACCREGFYQLNTTLCDGTKYCRESLEKYMQ